MEPTGLIPPNSTFSFTISQEEANKRLDHYIAKQFPLYSRSFFQRVIEDGLISINGKKVLKQGASLRAQDVVTVQFPPERRVDPLVLTEKHRGIEIVAQDPHFLILFKPAGLVVHSPDTRSTAPTLVDWIINNYAEVASVGAVDRPGIVHRLDKDTSGIMIVSRTNYAHAILGQMFKDRAISKTYLAIVQGHPPKTGIIDLPIGRDPRNPTKMSTFPHSAAGRSSAIRTACTNYTVIEYFQNHSLVEVKPITGRTHQIRVHFAAIGHPLVGDSVYGRSSHLIKRHALHAHKIAFIFDGASHEFSYEAPEDFKTLLHELARTL